MAIKRIVANIETAVVRQVQAFYAELFDLHAVMDQGWIVTLAADTTAPIQISIASEGGSGTPVPDLSIEVDNVDETYTRAKKLGHQIVYGITDEPWGIRRFYVVDPAGKTVNVSMHL